MFCGMCGSEMKSDDKFCINCGWQNVKKQSEETIEEVKVNEDVRVNENVIEAENFNNNYYNFTDNAVVKPPRKYPAWYIKLIAVIITILMISFFDAVCINFVVNRLTNPEKFKEILIENEFTQEIIWSAEFTEDNVTLGEFLVDEIADNVGEKEAKEIIEVLEVDDYVNELFANIVTGALTAEGIPEIDSDVLINTFEENQREIEDIIGEKLSEDDIIDTKESIMEYTNDFNREIRKVNEEYFDDNSFSVIKTGTELATLAYVVILVVCVTIILLMYYFSKTGIYRGFRCIAISSGISFVTIFGLSKLFQAVVSDINISTSSTNDLIISFLNEIFSMLSISGIIVGVIFGICLITAVIMHILYNKKTAI